MELDNLARPRFSSGRRGLNNRRRQPVSGIRVNRQRVRNSQGVRIRKFDRPGRRQGGNRRRNGNSKQKRLTKEGLDMDLDRYMGKDDTAKFKLDKELDDYFSKEN